MAVHCVRPMAVVVDSPTGPEETAALVVGVAVCAVVMLVRMAAVVVPTRPAAMEECMVAAVVVVLQLERAGPMAEMVE